MFSHVKRTISSFKSFPLGVAMLGLGLALLEYKVDYGLCVWVIIFLYGLYWRPDLAGSWAHDNIQC